MHINLATLVFTLLVFFEEEIDKIYLDLTRSEWLRSGPHDAILTSHFVSNFTRWAVLHTSSSPHLLLYME